MSHRRAKRIRQTLLPESVPATSRGQIIRELTEYRVIRAHTTDRRREARVLILDPTCPRSVIQREKRSGSWGYQ